MSVARVACRAQVALQAPPVSVEVHLGSGLPSFSIVGLAGPEVKESKERVRAALVNSGFELPAGRINGLAASLARGHGDAIALQDFRELPDTLRARPAEP